VEGLRTVPNEEDKSTHARHWTLAIFSVLTFNSVTENRRVKDVRMMVWYVQQEAGKRQNLNSYREDMPKY